MKAQKIILAMALLFGTTMFISCNDSTAGEDSLYEQSIDKGVIKDSDR